MNTEIKEYRDDLEFNLFDDLCYWDEVFDIPAQGDSKTQAGQKEAGA